MTLNHHISHHGGKISMRSATPGSLQGPPLVAPCARNVYVPEGREVLPGTENA
jgi:hypothetical protein